jgi:aryl-alcohol dehydrogenase-like predicted oxidoreductase
MRYKIFGSTGLRVSELCLGTMTFGEEWQFGASRDESYRIFEAFGEAGGNFIDTANTYTFGTSEKLVGEFARSERNYFVLSTKYSLNTRLEDINSGGNHRKNMIQSLEQSLRRLTVEYIDLYWLHAWDFLTSVDEVMRGLEDLVRNGKVLYIGISDTPAWIVSRANMLADLRGWASFSGIQVEYNLIERSAERELLPMARSLGLGITGWAPLAGGVLSGKYTKTGETVTVMDSRRGEWLNGERLHESALYIADCVRSVAAEIGCTPSQVALSWIREQPGAIIPIICGRTMSQIKENLDCLNVRLEPSHLRVLNDASQCTLGFPHSFLASEPVLQALFGAQRHLLDISVMRTAEGGGK